MNILYCGDKNIEDGLIISILSLMDNVQDELNVYVLTIDFHNIKPVSDDCIKLINSKMKEHNINNLITKIDITNLFEKNIPIENMETRFTPCCMLRLFADEIDILPDKILYLDNDVVCRKDCTNFYNQDISKYEFVRSVRLLW